MIRKLLSLLACGLLSLTARAQVPALAAPSPVHNALAIPVTTDIDTNLSQLVGPGGVTSKPFNQKGSEQLAGSSSGNTVTTSPINSYLEVTLAPTISSISPVTRAAGGPAITLTIVGTDFTPATTVSFGTVSLTQISSTSNTLIVSVPASALATAGTFPVSVDNAAGTSNALPFTLSAVGSGLIEDFEAATKFAYAAGPLALASGPWEFVEALSGNQPVDKFNGRQSARIRGGGSVTMLFDKFGGANVVELKAALYNNDIGATFQVEISTDGGASYSTVPGAPATLTSTLTPYALALNTAGNIRLRISNTNPVTGTSPRINIDDLRITDYTLTAIRESQANAGFTVSPNPAHDVITVRHRSRPVAGEQAVLFDLTGRVVSAKTLSADGVISVAGLVSGMYVLRMAGFVQRVMFY